MMYHIDYFRPVLIYIRPPWLGNRLFCVLRDYNDWVFQGRVGVPYTPFEYHTVILAGPHGFVINKARAAQMAPTPWQLN